MRILTDDPLGAAELLSGCTLRRWEQNRLAGGERELVAALGIGPVFSTEATGAGQFWDTLTVVSEAPRSQFAALNHLLGAGYRLTGRTVCLAGGGRHFQGQREREWLGALGNLHASVAVPTRMLTTHAGAGLSMLPVVAAIDAVVATTGGRVRPAIKWVNDLVVGERKLGGVLTGARISGHSLEDVIWGVGINVGVLPAVRPTPFVPAVTCLQAVPGAEHVTLAALFSALLAAIERRFADLTRDGAASLFTAYHGDSLVLGRSVTVWDEADCRDPDPGRWGPPSAHGRVTEIRDDLTLRLDDRCEVVHRGRLALQASALRSPAPPEPTGSARRVHG